MPTTVDQDSLYWRLRHGQEKLWTSYEVSQLIRVDPKTVTNWAHTGRMDSIRLPGGQYRFFDKDVRMMVEGGFSSNEDAG